MNKELDRLDHLRKGIQYINQDESPAFISQYEEDLDIIETSLKRLEEHDEIFKKYDIKDIWLEPALYVIKNHFPMDTETQLKKFKALENIKKKTNLTKTNDGKKALVFVVLETEEEYDLLKEVLVDE